MLASGVVICDFFPMRGGPGVSHPPEFCSSGTPFRPISGRGSVKALLLIGF